MPALALACALPLVPARALMQQLLRLSKAQPRARALLQQLLRLSEAQPPTRALLQQPLRLSKAQPPAQIRPGIPAQPSPSAHSACRPDSRSAANRSRPVQPPGRQPPTAL